MAHSLKEHRYGLASRCDECIYIEKTERQREEHRGSATTALCQIVRSFLGALRAALPGWKHFLGYREGVAMAPVTYTGSLFVQHVLLSLVFL